VVIEASRALRRVVLVSRSKIPSEFGQAVFEIGQAFDGVFEHQRSNRAVLSYIEPPPSLGGRRLVGARKIRRNRRLRDRHPP